MPTAAPPLNSGFGCAGAAALGERVAVGVDVDLGIAGRAVGDEVHAVLARPGRARGVGGAVPERRMRRLQRPQRHRHVGILIMLAGIAERVVGQRRDHAVVGVDEDVARILRGDLVIAELERRHAAPDADLHAAVAQVIEDADLFGETQRRIERQEIDQRSEPDALGRARDRGEVKPGNRHEIERRRVVLGDMEAVEARVLDRLGEGQALVKRGGDRPVRALDVIEESDLHGASLGDALSGATMMRTRLKLCRPRESGDPYAVSLRMWHRGRQNLDGTDYGSPPSRGRPGN